METDHLQTVDPGGGEHCDPGRGERAWCWSRDCTQPVSPVCCDSGSTPQLGENPIYQPGEERLARSGYKIENILHITLVIIGRKENQKFSFYQKNKLEVLFKNGHLKCKPNR